MSDLAHRGELKSGGSPSLKTPSASFLSNLHARWPVGCFLAIVPIIALVLDFLKADEVFILPTRTTLSALLVSEFPLECWRSLQIEIWKTFVTFVSFV
jgi:hypothetical protein